jgi:hypothetical protein
MRGAAILLFLSAFALPCFAAKRVAVDQLERVISTPRSKNDAKTADAIYGLELTERMSAARLVRELALLPGPASRQALHSLADVSEFLDLPAADLPPTPPPDRESEIALWKMALANAGKTISALPNFFATRETTHFVDTPSEPPRNTPDTIRYAPLHQVGDESVTVLYRDGHEFLDTKGTHHASLDPNNFGLSTEGEFGPILETVLADSGHGHVFWSHWEQGVNGQIAVFRYEVAKPESHYTVNSPGPKRDTQFIAPYHGEVGIDPADGSILRLTMVADLSPNDRVAKADVLMNYGPVQIGGATYICPLNSVALTLVHEVRVNSNSYTDDEEQWGPLQTLVNDVVFRNYHLFRAEIRILTDDSSGPNGSSPPAPPPAAPNR